MAKDLLLNHYSIRDDGALSDCEVSGKSIVLQFFNTIRQIINSEEFEQYYISDTDFWNISLTPNVSLGSFLNSLSPDQIKWVYQLKKLTQTTTDTFFSPELLEQIIDYTPRIPLIDASFDSLGCAACLEDLVVVSFATQEIWNNHKIIIQWYDSNGTIIPAEYGLGEFFYNISAPSHIDEVLALFPADDGPISHDKWLLALPTTKPTDLFWAWFDALTESAKGSLFRKANDIQTRNWHARYKTSFQQLGGGLCEIRCDLRGGGTVRVYTKVITVKKVVLLLGSDKNGQQEAIRTAKDLAVNYQ